MPWPRKSHVLLPHWKKCGRFYRVPLKSLLRLQIKRANDIQMRFHKNFLAPLFSLSLSLGHFFSSWGKRRLKFLHSTSSTVHQATQNRLVTLGQCTLYDSDANLRSIYQSKYSKSPTGSDEVLEEWKMSSEVTLTENGIGFSILILLKMCVKLSGIYRNKY